MFDLCLFFTLMGAKSEDISGRLGELDFSRYLDFHGWTFAAAVVFGSSKPTSFFFGFRFASQKKHASESSP